MNDTEDLALPLVMNQSEDVEEIKRQGRRIVDINYVFNSIKSISHAFECTFKNFVFTHEVRNGCISSFYFKYNFCNQKEIRLHSEEPGNTFNTNISNGNSSSKYRTKVKILLLILYYFT